MTEKKPPQNPEEKKALAKREVFNEIDDAQEAIEKARASGKYNILSPVEVIDFIPEFHSVSVRKITIDTREMRNGGEIYNVSGKFALAKTALDRIALNLGVSWDPRYSRQLDDESEPHYCAFFAVGWLPDFDGKTLHCIDGVARLDLRDGSSLCRKLANEADKSAAKYNKQSDKGEARIREMRAKILEHTQSRAKNRAIRTCGIKSAYTIEDLQKPFIVVRLVETGHTDDPELKRLYWEKRLEGRSMAMSLLYGPPPSGDSRNIIDGEAHIEAISVQRQPPPPVNAVEDYDEDTGEVTDDGLDPFGGER